MHDDFPKITVLMAVFNGEKYLGSAIDSVLAQTMPDLELIVVDDCSNDSSREIIESYASRDRRIRLIKNSRNLGPYPSANNGLEAARSPLIARMDADDICMPDRLAKQLEFMNSHPSCLLVGGGYRSIDATGKKRFDRPNPMDFATCAFVSRIRTPMAHPTFCFRKNLNDGTPVLYDANVPVAGDHTLAAALGSLGKIASLNDLLVQYRMHSGNISSNRRAEQCLFAHAAATRATIAHYPKSIADDMCAFIDVVHGQAAPTHELFRVAIRGVTAAIGHDSAPNSKKAIVERASGILAETFFREMPFKFAVGGWNYLFPLMQRIGRMKGILPNLNGEP